MRKSLFISFITILLITGCNFPLTQTAVPADAIATQVAVFLTQTAQVPTQTSTIAPLVNTQTPTISPTPSPTPSDPASSLGSPKWSNGLNSSSAFGLTGGGYSDAYTNIYLQNGKMILTSLQAVGWKGWRLTDRSYADYYLEAQFTTHDCSGLDQYGLVFRSADYSNGSGFYYMISCDGRYALLGGTSEADLKFLQNWTGSPEIKAGGNQTNRIGVYLKGSNIKLFINGKPVYEVSNGTLQTATKLGAFIAAVTTPGFTVEMSQIQLWSVP